jgi:hypothetical protein
VAPCHGPPYHVMVAPPVALRCESAPHHITPWHPISTLQAVACSGGQGCCCCRPSLGPLSLSSPVCTSLPPYEQLLVAEGSGAMGHHLPLAPVIILSCIGGAGAGAVGIGVGLVVVIVSSPPCPPSCSSSLWRW